MTCPLTIMVHTWISPLMAIVKYDTNWWVKWLHSYSYEICYQFPIMSELVNCAWQLSKHNTPVCLSLHWDSLRWWNIQKTQNVSDAPKQFKTKEFWSNIRLIRLSLGISIFYSIIHEDFPCIYQKLQELRIGHSKFTKKLSLCEETN